MTNEELENTVSGIIVRLIDDVINCTPHDEECSIDPYDHLLLWAAVGRRVTNIVLNFPTFDDAGAEGEKSKGDRIGELFGL